MARQTNRDKPKRVKQSKRPASQRRTLETLQESEERYRTLFTNMTEGFALGEGIFTEEGTPCDFRFLEINDAFEQQSGLQRSQVLGKPMTQVLPNLEQRWVDTYCGVALSGQSIRFVSYNQDTQRHYDVFCYSPAHGRFAILFRDITAQKQTEQALEQLNAALRESEEKYRTLFNSVKEGFTLNRALYDEKGHVHDFLVLEANPAAERANGLARAEFVGKTWRDLWPGAEEYWWSICNDVILKGTDVRYENYAAVHDRWYEVHHFSAGQDRLGSIFTDITDRKRAEQEIESTARFPAENPSPVLRVSAEGVLLYANPASAPVIKEWGCSIGDVVPETWRGIIGRALADQKNQSVDMELQDRVYAFFVSPVAEFRYVNLYGRDITERKQAEEQVHALNRHLEQRATELAVANRELEAFSYSVSHDLRTPLASIDSFSRMLAEEHGAQLTDEAQKYLQLIRGNVQVMHGLIQALLTFSRTERQPLQKRQVSMADLVRQVWIDLEAQRAGRQVDWVVGTLPDTTADPLLLKQVLVNLLSNALKFSRLRTVARIEIGSFDQDEERVYFIKDNGVGFAMEHADRLFGVFQRLHHEEEYDGTGVGLAIVERILGRHGGWVRAEAAVDQGATFYFTLGR